MIDNDQFRAGAMRAYREHVSGKLGYRIPAVTSGAALVELARAATADELEAQCNWRPDPPFPGASEEPAEMPTGWRMICACRLYVDDQEQGVVYTTFVGGRPVAIAVNGPGTEIPEEWKPIASR